MKKILVVGGTNAMRALFHAYGLTLVSSCEEAREAVASAKFDLVIVSIRKNGITVEEAVEFTAEYRDALQKATEAAKAAEFVLPVIWYSNDAEVKLGEVVPDEVNHLLQSSPVGELKAMADHLLASRPASIPPPAAQSAAQ